MYLKHSVVGIYYKGSIAVSKTANVGSIPAVPVIADKLWLDSITVSNS